MMWKIVFFILSVSKATLSLCGQGRNASLSDKIVGGRAARDGEFPFQVSLQKRSASGYYHTCGAVLVSSDWLVTAAHCIQGNSVSVYKVVIGGNNLTKITPPNLMHSVMTIVIKQGFNPENFNNDIALIKIFPPAPNFASSICLPDFRPDFNQSAVVVGWGATTDGGIASLSLQAAEVNLIPRTQCLQYYQGLTESMICAGYADGGIDACQGDSGGPLLQHRNGTSYLTGVVSWGIGCAEPKHPGVYTDVSQFVAWIRYYISA